MPWGAATTTTLRTGRVVIVRGRVRFGLSAAIARGRPAGCGYGMAVRDKGNRNDRANDEHRGRDGRERADSRSCTVAIRRT